jgi:hypothetical protein
MRQIDANHPHLRAKAAVLYRRPGYIGLRATTQPLEPGVKFFVLFLECMGARTTFSCQGHPFGWYLIFQAPVETACQITKCGFFSVHLESSSPDCLQWALRLTGNEHGHGMDWNHKTKERCLTWAADAWYKNLGLQAAFEKHLRQHLPARLTTNKTQQCPKN